MADRAGANGQRTEFNMEFPDFPFRNAFKTGNRKLGTGNVFKEKR